MLVVEDVVDTGLTLNFLARTLALRNPASLSAVTLLDRPYRRLVDDVPLDYVGFTVPDELFAGYGLGLDERWRALPDLHFVAIEELPSHLTGDSYRAREPKRPREQPAAPWDGRYNVSKEARRPRRDAVSCSLKNGPGPPRYVDDARGSRADPPACR